MVRSAVAFFVSTGLLVSLSANSARAKDALVTLMQGQNLATGERVLAEVVPTGKARFLSVLASANAPEMHFGCYFTSQPSTSEVPTFPNVYATALFVSDTLGSIQTTLYVEPILPANRVPVMGPYLHCVAFCAAGPCTDIAADAYLSTK